MNIISLDSLLNDLLRHTLSLEKIVLEEESDPEKWIELLDKRQEAMDQLSERFAEGFCLTEAQKQIYLQPAYEADQRIVSIIERKKQASESQLANVQKGKVANQFYGGNSNSYSPYGAFFDKKK